MLGSPCSGSRAAQAAFVLLALALVACHGDAAPPDGPPANPLFQELFGAHDADLPGRSCVAGHDDCRGSVALYVCASGSCQKCASDADCTNEYGYLGDQGGSFVTCGGDGRCHATSGDYGACDPGSPACRTANGWYPCLAGECAHCTTADECTASYGPNWICGDLGGPGQCIESLPPGP